MPELGRLEGDSWHPLRREVGLATPCSGQIIVGTCTEKLSRTRHFLYVVSPTLVFADNVAFEWRMPYALAAWKVASERIPFSLEQLHVQALPVAAFLAYAHTARQRSKGRMALADTEYPACPKHEDWMVLIPLEPPVVVLPYGTLELFRCANLSCPIFYIRGASEGFYTATRSGTLMNGVR